MGPVTTGKRAAPRALGAGAPRGPRRREVAPAPTGPLLLLALGITAAVVAWGYLVYLAIDFGTSARDGDAAGWWLLALSTLGAIACLFVAMMLGTRLVRAAARPTRRRPGRHARPAADERRAER